MSTNFQVTLTIDATTDIDVSVAVDKIDRAIKLLNVTDVDIIDTSIQDWW